MTAGAYGTPVQTFAAYYHEKTKYTPEGIARQAHTLDWDRQPMPYKVYPNGQQLDLKPLLKEQDRTSLLPRISQFLYLSYGVTAVIPHAERPTYLRTAPSAGGLYPAEIYVLGRGELAGIYNYQVLTHSLVQLNAQPVFDALSSACFDHPALRNSAFALVITGVFQRSAWRYEDRAYRRVFLDTGHLVGNIELAGGLSNFKIQILGGFQDEQLADLMFLNLQEEAPLLVVAVGDDPLVSGPTALASGIEVDFPSIEAGQRLSYLDWASRIRTTPEPPEIPARNDKYNFPFTSKISTLTAPLAWEGYLPEVIVRRRSTRQYTGADLALAELLQVLHFTYQPQAYQDQGQGEIGHYCDLSLLETFIAVLGVEGLEAGCYYYAPQAQELRQIRFRNFRQEIHYLCLGQDLGRDAGAVVFHTADLQKAVTRYGERAYRYLHLDAGHLGQRLNLAALRLGLGVSGIAGFFDDQVNEVLGIPTDEAVLYLTTLGRPSRS